MKELNEEEKKVILNKGTEAPFSGKYNDFYEKGIYQSSNVELRFINPKINLNQVVGGLALMMK